MLPHNIIYANYLSLCIYKQSYHTFMVLYIYSI